MNALGQAVVWCALQVTLVAAATVVLYAAVIRRGPALRSLVALTGMAVSIALTFAAFSPWPRWTAAVAGDSADAVTSRGNPETGTDSGAATSRTLVLGDGESAKTTMSAAETIGSFWHAFIDELEHRPPALEASANWTWRAIVGVVFALGAIVGGLRLIAAGLAVAAYRRFSQPVEEPSIVRLAAEIARELGCQRPMELRECPQLMSAVMLGWRRPLVLLPADWTQWTAAERRAVLAHEIAHARRGDFAAWVCAQLGLLLHFYHPLVHWLAARLRLDQELAADAAAARVSGGRQPYLRILADMALRQSDRLAGWPARAFLPTRRTFLRRIEMLRATKQVPAAASRRVCAVTVGVLVLAGLAAAGLRGSGQSAQAAVQRGNTEDRPRATVRSGAGGDAAKSSGAIYTGFIPNETQAFIVVRPADLLSRREMKPLTDFLANPENAATSTPWGLDLREIEQLSVTVIPPLQPRPNAAFPFGAVTIRATRPHEFQKLIENAAPQATRVPASGREYFVSDENGGIAWFRPDDRTIVFGSVQDVARMIASGPEANWERLTSGPAAQAIADAHYAIVVDTALVESLLSQAQGQQPGGARRETPAAAIKTMLQSAYAPLWEQSESVTFALRLEDKLTVEWLFASETEQNAEAVRRTIEALLTLGRNMSGKAADTLRRETAGQPGEPAVTAALKLAEELLANAEIEQNDGGVRLSTSADLQDAQTGAIAALTESVKAARGAARRAQSMNNLKQIGLAFHNYADQHGRFPPAVLYGPDGKTPHSWRVALLPYLDQEALYRQYRLNEPWDSPNNKKIAETAMPIYRHPDAPQDSTSAAYFALVGENTIFTGEKAAGDKAGRAFRDITDGTSNTILVVEAQRDIPWTKPEDIPFDPEKDLPELGGYTEGGFHAAFADGSVKFIADAIEATTLKALISRAGNEVIDHEKLNPRPRR